MKRARGKLVPDRELARLRARKRYQELATEKKWRGKVLPSWYFTEELTKIEKERAKKVIK